MEDENTGPSAKQKNAGEDEKEENSNDESDDDFNPTLAAMESEIKPKVLKTVSSLTKDYNKLIKLPSSYSYEKLYKKENVYDIIIVLNFNMRPIVKKKGSAIFMHVAKNNYFPTRGCIALQKKDLIFILSWPYVF